MTLVSEVEIAPDKRYSSFVPSLEDEGQSCSVLEPERVISKWQVWCWVWESGPPGADQTFPGQRDGILLQVQNSFNLRKTNQILKITLVFVWNMSKDVSGKNKKLSNFQSFGPKSEKAGMISSAHISKKEIRNAVQWRVEARVQKEERSGRNILKVLHV